MLWDQTEKLTSKSYICGHCENSLASEKGFRATRPSTSGSGRITTASIYICHHCQKPTFFYNKEQVPGPAFGTTVEHLPSEEVRALYEEARGCMKVNAHTAAAMCCRKLLMNVAVSLGAKEGEKFWQYVEFLKDSGFLPINAKEWLTYIKDRGNEANHEIKIVEREDAEQLIEFSEFMLKIIYEVPAKMKAKADDLGSRPVGSPPTHSPVRRAPDASKGSPF